jgi:hypothetical protein
MSVSEDKYDAFICHAREDKAEVARPLAQTLSDAGLKIWYDEFSLRLGDSLRQSIESGLSQSRYGIVILSPSFFEKNWPQAELNGLFAKEITFGKTIIPIWHNIDYDQLVRRSPIIADRVATQTSEGLDRVVERLLEVLDPDCLHLSKTQYLVTASPKRFRLNTGGWSVRTAVVVSNRSGVAIYAVILKITIQTRGVKSEEVQIDTGGQRSAIGGTLDPVTFSGDAMIHDCIDKDSREAIFVTFYMIPAQESREIIVIGRAPKDSEAALGIIDFRLEPQEVMEKEGQLAIGFQFPESVTVKGLRLKLRR